MSTTFALATVTAILKDLLNNGIIDGDLSSVTASQIKVTALPPDRISLNSGEPSQLNLFLYQVTPNIGWRNAGLPSRDDRGQRLTNPPMALDLHYLLTAYGSEEFHSEILLGHAMHLMHETPMISREAIRRSFSAALDIDNPPIDLPVAFRQLANSNLDEQVELIKIIPESLNAEEISKLWAAFQANYRPTAAYKASVVLVEGTRSTRSPLPVKQRGVYVHPFRNPFIESVKNAAGGGTPVTASSTLLIKGQNLYAEEMAVLIGGFNMASPNIERVEAGVEITLPDPLPQGLYAGVQTARIVHSTQMGEPQVSHRGAASNVEAFILRPEIAVHAPTNVQDITLNGVITKKGKLQVDFKPNVGKAQDVVLYLNQHKDPPDLRPNAYSFPAPPDNGVVAANQEDTASIVLEFEKLVPGDYFVRVQVDGAESTWMENLAGELALPKATI